MTKGRKRIPDSVKVLQGTDQPSRMSGKVEGVEVFDELPEPPAWIGGGAANAEYHRLGKVLIANKILTNTSTGGFLLLCALHGQIVSNMEQGLGLDTKLITQYRALITEYGLTPATAHKMKPEDLTKKPQGFAALKLVKS